MLKGLVAPTHAHTETLLNSIIRLGGISERSISWNRRKRPLKLIVASIFFRAIGRMFCRHACRHRGNDRRECWGDSDGRRNGRCLNTSDGHGIRMRRPSAKDPRKYHRHVDEKADRRHQAKRCLALLARLAAELSSNQRRQGRDHNECDCERHVAANDRRCRAVQCCNRQGGPLSTPARSSCETHPHRSG